MFCLSTIKRLNAPIARNRRIKLQGLTSNNTVAYVDDSGSECVRLHNTLVAKRTALGGIILDSGGFRTVTTKRRINEALRAWNDSRRVCQKAGEWYVWNEFGSIEFVDGDTI